MEIVFATNNLHKLEEISALLGGNFQLLGLKDLNISEEIPEDHETLEEKRRMLLRRHGISTTGQRKVVLLTTRGWKFLP